MAVFKAKPIKHKAITHSFKFSFLTTGCLFFFTCSFADHFKTHFEKQNTFPFPQRRVYQEKKKLFFLIQLLSLSELYYPQQNILKD